MSKARRYRYPMATLVIVLSIALYTYRSDLTCISIPERQQCLKDDFGSQVYDDTYYFVSHSPIITQDVGNIEFIVPHRWGHSSLDVWLDWNANLDLDVHGNKGIGRLSLTFVGSDRKNLNISFSARYSPTWQFAGKKVPLWKDGTIDKGMLEELPEKYR